MHQTKAKDMKIKPRPLELAAHSSYSLVGLALGLALGAAPLLGKDKYKSNDKDPSHEARAVTPSMKCSDRDSKDQDDMCIWVHPSDPSLSSIISSDKKANRLFVYDLEGRTLQSIPARQPGNIDMRYGFSL